MRSLLATALIDLHNKFNCKPKASILSVIVSNMLPFEPFYDACDLVSKEEIKIGSGKMVHALLMKDQLIVSSEYAEMLKTLPHDKINACNILLQQSAYSHGAGYFI